MGEEGRELIGEVGELVVTSAMPSAPLFLWGDESEARYHESYYATYPGVWRHGDLSKVNARGGVYVYGRSDATLNRFGVRIGSGEIYSVLEEVEGVADALVVCCETPDGGYYVPLFLQLKPGRTLDAALKRSVVERLRDQASPRHVPDEILQAPSVPYTLTGKKMEVPVRKLVMGASVEDVASAGSMSDPAALDWYAAFAARPEVTVRWTSTRTADLPTDSSVPLRRSK